MTSYFMIYEPAREAAFRRHKLRSRTNCDHNSLKSDQWSGLILTEIHVILTKTDFSRGCVLWIILLILLCISEVDLLISNIVQIQLSPINSF